MNMRRGFHCRRCEELQLFRANGGRRPFGIAGAEPHYAPDRPFKLERLLLDVTVNPKAKTLSGTIIQKVRVVAPDQTRLVLDQVGLAIEEVKFGGRSANFYTEGQKLQVELPEAPKVGDEIEFSIRYHVTNPRRGLYFTGPDEHYPKKRYQVWSQGQDEDNRHWFPTFDYPNQKVLTEVIATVPQGFTAVSNGALVSMNETDSGTRFHYRLGTPHVTYLITLVVGEFSSWEDKGPRNLPIQYYVEPGREEDGKRAFGNTPKMIEAYEARIGVPYPYEKYSQATVQDFIFGGMENTSATTQTEMTLHDTRAHIDFTSDPLVSHELAHQWFGDLLTCRDWSHGWLNEGFATFMERVWIENDKGPHGGLDEAKYYSYLDFKEYLDEDAKHYRRPIVCNTYIEPIDLFDRHLYQKGGLVLNLIRHVLGEELFWKSIQLYVTRHRGQNVETIDLIRAIEDATGRNLRRFFDEWVFGAGHPEFEVSYSWHDDKKLAELVIEQKQTGGKPWADENGARTHLFHVPVVIELTFEGGRKLAHTLTLSEARERLLLEAPAKPVMVRLDPGANIPKTLKFPRPKELLLHQLAHDQDCMGRIEAAVELAKIADREVIDALGSALTRDSFWGVQAEIAGILAERRTDQARDLLVAALPSRSPKARRAILKALGSFKDQVAAHAIRRYAEKDESYFVEAEATSAWAMTQTSVTDAPSPAMIESAERFLLDQLNKPSYREVIRAAALKGLAELPGVGRGERPRVMQALIGETAPGKPKDSRAAAILSLGQIAKTAVRSELARVLDVFAQLADESDFKTHMALVGALEGTESPEAIPILAKVKELDWDGRVRRACITAIDKLTLAGSTPESVHNLKSALEKLEEEYGKLKMQLEELRSQHR